MPLYEYKCVPAGHRFEVRHGMNEEPVQTCPECGGEVRRVIHPAGVIFRGSGFYVTDSRKTTSSPTSGQGKGGETKSDQGAAKAEPGTKSDSSSKS